MVEFDTELIMDVASKVTRLKMFPYFDAAHYIMMVLAVREDLATGTVCVFLFCYFLFAFCFFGIYWLGLRKWDTNVTFCDRKSRKAICNVVGLSCNYAFKILLYGRNLGCVKVLA